MISTSHSATSPVVELSVVGPAGLAGDLGRDQHPRRLGRALDQRRQRGGDVALLAGRAHLGQAARQRLAQLARGGEPVQAIGRRGANDRLGQPRRNRGDALAGIADAADPHGVGDVRVRTLERAHAGQALVQDDARRIHVGAAILRPAPDALGRGVAILAHEDAGRRSPRGGPRGTEVDQLGGPAGRQDDVVRAQVAVDQPQRPMASASSWTACSAWQTSAITCSVAAMGRRSLRASIRLCANRSVTPGTNSMAMK